VPPDAGPILEGSQTIAPQRIGTPYLSEDKSAVAQQDASDAIAKHGIVPTFEQITLGTLTVTQEVTRAQSRSAASDQSVYEDLDLPLVTLIREAQQTDP
jgi:hypothetical protein